LIKNIIYNSIAFVLPRSVLNFLGSLNSLKFLRDWLFDRKKVLKPISFITWNNLKFYFRAPLQILRKAKINGIESSLTKSIIRLINKDSNVIDIGSNYGFITLACSNFIRDGMGKVFSFECDVNCYKNLESSIKRNAFDNIELFNAFVGNKNTSIIKTVDSLIHGHCKKIDLIKIDTDGTDLECLEGCEKIIKESDPIIVIEVNNNFNQIVGYLLKIRYHFFYDQHLREIDITSKNIIPNLFCSRYSLKK
tara:strand:- start:124 stop:873 length:750 start_codon:yes stop_codon:yes gene_type:complete